MAALLLLSLWMVSCNNNNDRHVIESSYVEDEESSASDDLEAAAKREEMDAIDELFNYTDLGLPSGTLWKNRNEEKLCDFHDAFNKYGNNLPTKKDFEELINVCDWEWTGEGYVVTGPNGESIYFYACGYVDFDRSDERREEGFYGRYWSSTRESQDFSWILKFEHNHIDVGTAHNRIFYPICLVKRN